MKWDPAWTPRLVALLLSVAAAAWLIDNTEWVEGREPVPMSDELRSDGTVLARHFLQQLGWRVHKADNLQQMPPPGATLLLSARFWRLVGGDERLRRWVDAGGHLVIDHTVLSDPPADGWLPTRLLPREADAKRVRDDWCRVLSPVDGTAGGIGNDIGNDSAKDSSNDRSSPSGFNTCARAQARLQPSAAATWALHSPELGTEVQRLPFGRGRVTAFAGNFAFDAQNASSAFLLPGGIKGRIDGAFLRNFSNRGLLEGDNAALLAALVGVLGGVRDQPQPNREVWFITRVQRAPLPLWLWQQAAPVLALAGVALVLALWRGALRFGPLQAEPPALRRSLSTQVVGLADFLHRHQPAALHAASVRALRETALRCVPGWQRLKPAARTAALARATALPLAALEMAQEPHVPRDAQAWSQALALLETARRTLLAAKTPAKTPVNTPSSTPTYPARRP